MEIFVTARNVSAATNTALLKITLVCKQYSAMGVIWQGG